MGRPSPTRQPPRRFRFGLRSLFVLMTVICVWLGCSMNWIRQRHAMRHELGLSLDEPQDIEANSVWVPNTKQAPAGLWMFGEQGICYLFVLDTKHLERAEQLFPESEIIDCQHQLCIDLDSTNPWAIPGPPATQD